MPQCELRCQIRYSSGYGSKSHFLTNRTIAAGLTGPCSGAHGGWQIGDRKFYTPPRPMTSLPCCSVRSAGFIEPYLPSPAEKPPTGPEWVHEIKHDVIPQATDGKVSRDGFPSLSPRS